jgi:hypothetical protein
MAGNMLWALSEVYYDSDDDGAEPMWISNRHNRALLRWWSSWILFSALFSIVTLYFIWLPLTCMGYLRTIGDEDGLPIVDKYDRIKSLGQRKAHLINASSSAPGNVYLPVSDTDPEQDEEALDRVMSPISPVPVVARWNGTDKTGADGSDND